MTQPVTPGTIIGLVASYFAASMKQSPPSQNKVENWTTGDVVNWTRDNVKLDDEDLELLRKNKITGDTSSLSCLILYRKGFTLCHKGRISYTVSPSSWPSC